MSQPLSSPLASGENGRHASRLGRGQNRVKGEYLSQSAHSLRENDVHLCTGRRHTRLARMSQPSPMPCQLLAFREIACRQPPAATELPSGERQEINA